MFGSEAKEKPPPLSADAKYHCWHRWQDEEIAWQMEVMSKADTTKSEPGAMVQRK